MSSVARARLPSLDGLRALSIVLVIAGHSASFVFPHTRVAEYCEALAQVGVSIFFVISGFLITHLLVEEQSREGAIDLRAFYLRRVFRILPPFFGYLALLTLARWLEGDPIHLDELAVSAGFLWNYLSPRDNWALGHTWSLAVEEQFYLLWPGLLVLLGVRRAPRAAFVLIALVPLIRVAQYFLFPGSRAWIPISLQGRLDTLMFGCALAMFWKDERLQRAIRSVPRVVLPAALAFVLGVSPLLAVWARGRYLLTVGETLEGACIAAVIAISVAGSAGRWFALLNARPVVHLGLISYSLYLYQQPFLDPTHPWTRAVFPLGLLAAFVCAELSYRGIEQTTAKWRTRLFTPRIKSTASVI